MVKGPERGGNLEILQVKRGLWRSQEIDGGICFISTNNGMRFKHFILTGIVHR